MTYIPDAKAFTDAPEKLVVLIKQRRRWMNGALFAAWRVLGNFPFMLGLKNASKHPLNRQIGMLFFLIYHLTNQTFNFFIVGSSFAAIKILFNELLKKVPPSIFQGNDRVE